MVDNNGWTSEDVTSDLLGIYLSEIRTIRRLTRAEEERLVQVVLEGREAAVLPENGQYRQDSIARGLKAEQELVNAHLPLVVSLVKLLNRGAPGIDLKDLIQAGNLGLVYAAKRFDPERNARFSTCASWWIFKFVNDEYRHNKYLISMSDSAYRRVRSKNKLWLHFVQENGREPTFNELRDYLVQRHGFADCSEATIFLQQIFAIEDEIVSLDLPVGKDQDTTLGDFIEERRFKGPDMLLEDLVLSEEIIEVLETLTDKEQTVITMLCGLKGLASTYEEIADKLGMTGREDHRIQKVKSIELSAFRKLRHPSRSRKLSYVL